MPFKIEVLFVCLELPKAGDRKNMSSAGDVGSYIEAQPQEWQPALTELRALCRRELIGYSEGMAYGLPSYSRNGQMEVGFGKQARYLSLYILKKTVLDAHRNHLGRIPTGKGCIRYQRPEQIDWASLHASFRGRAPVKLNPAE